MTKRQNFVMIMTGVAWAVAICGSGILTKTWFDEGGLGQNVATVVATLVVLVSIFPSFLLALKLFGGSPSVKEEEK